ncbi:MAG: NAD-dependent DNA ligase LigA, partial [Planctomycetaceae bacterium]|nr:NAD-dependent DNA ligase LigA [Planctomycetaceae bacterium]
MPLNELRKKIRQYDELYRQGLETGITDTEYDKLIQELRRLEAESGEPVPSDSPTQKVGSDLSSAAGGTSKRVRHRIPMLSIENSYNLGELSEFGSRVQ